MSRGITTDKIMIPVQYVMVYKVVNNEEGDEYHPKLSFKLSNFARREIKSAIADITDISDLMNMRTVRFKDWRRMKVIGLFCMHPYMGIDREAVPMKVNCIRDDGEEWVELIAFIEQNVFRACLETSPEICDELEKDKPLKIHDLPVHSNSNGVYPD